MKKDSGEAAMDMGGSQAWDVIWLKAVARAWKDDEFRALLVKSPDDALRKLGYELPEGVKLTVVEAPSDEYNWDEKKGWRLPSTDMKLPLPPKPKAEDQAVALSALMDYPGMDPGKCGDPCCF